MLLKLIKEPHFKVKIEYINEQYDPAMDGKMQYCVKKWNKPFALKGVMSVKK